jgi:hypothetical protein
MTARTGLGQDNCGRKANTGQPGQYSQDRTAGTSQPHTGRSEKSERTGQVGQTPEGTGHPENDSKDMLARYPGQDSWDRTVRT